MAHAIRFGTTLIYLFIEFPFMLAPKFGSALGASLRIAFALLVSGFIFIALFPAFRVGLLHLTLVGGFATITFSAGAVRAQRQLAKLKGQNRWLLIAIGLMLFAMVTRISGDFWPKISHYIYGAVIWIAGVLLGSCYTLPKVLQIEAE